MVPLLSCQSLAKSHGTRRLFQNITLGIEPGERIGLIGPNGAGKSTLLRILAGLERSDSGTVSAPRSVRVGYVAQEDSFDDDATVHSVLDDAARVEFTIDQERAIQLRIVLAKVGFSTRQLDQRADTLSGGWRKRLSIARAIVAKPDLLFLDEPTNHLDLEGVLWLERMLQEQPFAFVTITHDRYFLENVARRVIELSATYVEGYFSVSGSYTDFLLRREEYLSAQAHHEVALESIVRREIAWLRRGAQARSTKAKGRIDAAGRLIDDLSAVKSRNNQNKTAGIEFAASGRQTKELLVAKGLGKTLGGRTLFHDLDLTLTRGMKLGLVGANGSGKTTLLRILTGELPPDTGTIKAADGLQIVLFDQNRDQLNVDQTLKDALSPQSDYVDYRNSHLHVSAWAKRFLFRTEQLPMQVRYLSGGEQSRILIANLMLRPADVLILDEPTNDLDIPSLEVLEDSLSSFPGALILVTHDRYLLDKVCDDVLVLNTDGNGTARTFAGYEQYADWRETQAVPRLEKADKVEKSVRQTATTEPAPALVTLARLSASERRELKQIEENIIVAEEAVAKLERQMLLPEVASDAARLQACWNALPDAQAEVVRLYARWEELEARGTAAR